MPPTMTLMTRVRTATGVALCGAALSACPPAAAPVDPVKPVQVVVAPDAAVPLPLDQDLPRLAQRATRLYQEVAEAFAASGVDCAEATTRLRTLQRIYADVVAANVKVLHDGRARELRAALEPQAEQLDAAARAIVLSQTMSKCSVDRAFTDTFDELVGAPP